MTDGRVPAVAVGLGLVALVATGMAAVVANGGSPGSRDAARLVVTAPTATRTETPGPSAAEVPSPVANVIDRPAPPVPRADEAWVAEVSSATGIPAPAVRAYGDATLALADERPACRLGWTTLAAIGAIESGHGTHGGAILDGDGRPSVPIVGPALDGSPGVAAIRATAESTVWHGDPVWDHAVGPMQFIPSTWRLWAADGDGDGVADPQDVDDAALAAGRYLCSGGRDLATAAGWWAAVLSYNRDETYAAAVLTAADGYALATRG